MQGELSSKDENVKELRRWLDQAQGQLQNTQTALHEREADCKTLSLDLKAALADLQAFKVSQSTTLVCSRGQSVYRSGVHSRSVSLPLWSAFKHLRTTPSPWAVTADTACTSSGLLPCYCKGSSQKVMLTLM